MNLSAISHDIYTLANKAVLAQNETMLSIIKRGDETIRTIETQSKDLGISGIDTTKMELLYKHAEGYADATMEALVNVLITAMMLPNNNYMYIGYSVDEPVSGNRAIGETISDYHSYMLNLYKDLKADASIYLFMISPDSTKAVAAEMGKINADKSGFAVSDIAQDVNNTESTVMDV